MLDSSAGQTPAVGVSDAAKTEDQRTNYIVIDFKETDVLSRLVQSLDAPAEEAVTGTSPLSEVTPFGFRAPYRRDHNKVEMVGLRQPQSVSMLSVPGRGWPVNQRGSDHFTVPMYQTV